MITQGEKVVDSRTERGRCLFCLRRRQESWSQAGNGYTQVGKKAGESKQGPKAITGSHKRARKRLGRDKTNNTSQRHKQNELN